MIDAEEIKDVAGRLSLDPRVIEKDYVIGWVLAGIYNHPLFSQCANEPNKQHNRLRNICTYEPNKYYNWLMVNKTTTNP